MIFISSRQIFLIFDNIFQECLSETAGRNQLIFLGWGKTTEPKLFQLTTKNVLGDFKIC